MKVIIILGLVTTAIAASVHKPAEAAPKPETKEVDEVKIEKNEIHRHLDGTYEIDLELSDGQKRIENAVLKTVKDEDGNDKVILSISGISEYKNADGSIDHREYKADENGSDIKGNSLPHLDNEASSRSAVHQDAPLKSVSAKGGKLKSDKHKVVVPQSAAPKTEASKAAEPKTSEPKAAAPKAAVPKAGAPKAGARKAATPKSTAPKAAAPKVAQPQASEPKAKPASAERKLAEAENESENEDDENEDDENDDEESE